MIIFMLMCNNYYCLHKCATFVSPALHILHHLSSRMIIEWVALSMRKEDWVQACLRQKNLHTMPIIMLCEHTYSSWVVREKENFQKWVIEWNFLLLEITISCMPTNQTLSSTIIIKMSDVISILKINFNWLSRMFDHTNLKIFDCQTWLLFALWPWWSCHGQNGVNL